MPLTLGTFATTFSQLNDLISLFDGAESPEDVQAILHKLADDSSEEFHDLIADLTRSASLLATAEFSMPITNAEGRFAPGETYVQGQQAAADVARNLGLDELADEIEGIDLPPGFPFDGDGTESKILGYSDGFSKTASFVKTKSASTGIAGTDDEKKLSSFASRLDKLAAFHQ